MNVLLAFDKFKDSLPAGEACAVAGEALSEAGIRSGVERAPLTDGGEGFARILAEAAGGHIEHHRVCGPLGETIEAPLGWVDLKGLPSAAGKRLGLPVTAKAGRLAIVEMAAIAGLEQVPDEKRDPRHTTTFGIGEMIRIATAKEADAILLGIGGSATSDLGLGALQALGLELVDASGEAFAPHATPESWPLIAGFRGRIEVPAPPLYIACDVDNPLLGANGAAAVYGPQKGLLETDVPAFDALAGELADRLCDHFGSSHRLKEERGCGAAGGIGFGLKLACAASFVPGFSLVADWLELERKIGQADWILTGEGKFDRSSLNGKGPYALIQAAHERGIPIDLFAGKVDSAVESECRERFPKTAFHTITPPGQALADALERGAENLRTTILKHVPDRKP